MTMSHEPWNDGAVQQISDLQSNADALEMRAQRHWDEAASSLLDRFTPEPFPNPEQEITP